MKFAKLAAMVIICVFSPLANASVFHIYDRYVGVEIIQTNQDYKATFGKKNFKKNTQNYSMFAGTKFTKHFGLELGYEFQPNRGKSTKLVVGDFGTLTPAVPIINGEFLDIQTHIKSRHPYLGLFGEKTSNRIKLQVLLGLSVSQVKARSIALENTEFKADTVNFSKTKVVPMVKLCATYMVTDAVGLMATGNYRNMSSFKIKTISSDNDHHELRLKDSFGVGFGVMYSWGGM